MSRLHILLLASEASPWAKTGGLADVAGALPAALEALGHRVTLVMPRYAGVRPPGDRRLATRVRLGSVAHDAMLHVSDISADGRLVMVDIPHLYDRPGLYGEGGHDYPDNAERFAMFAASALELGFLQPDEPAVDVIHAHDWQAGLAPVLARVDPRYHAKYAQAGLVTTIHNLAYQGAFDRDVVPRLGMPWSVFTMDTGEFWGRFSFLKAGITAADIITTVSPSYARETQRQEFGAGLEGVLSARSERYVGILNGIDTSVWDPATDPLIPANYSAGDLSGKAECKRALLEAFGFPRGDDAMSRPIVGMVSRLVEQKGLDLIDRASADLIELDAFWIFVGQGDEKYESKLRALAGAHPSRVGVHVGFDERLAHLVEAGADIFLMPSVFEPCGLNQMYSLRYGTVPVVTAVGGLDDTVQPYTLRAKHANGFKFRDRSPETLTRVLRQATRLYNDKAQWQPLMERGMRADHSWRASAVEYVKVYKRARQAKAFRAGW